MWLENVENNAIFTWSSIFEDSNTDKYETTRKII